MDGTGPRGVETSFLRDILFIVFKRKIPLIAMFVLGLMIVTPGLSRSRRFWGTLIGFGLLFLSNLLIHSEDVRVPSLFLNLRR